MKKEPTILSRSLGGSTPYKDFLYRVSVRRDADEAKSFSIGFGIDEIAKVGYAATFDFDEGLISIGSEKMPVIKSSSFAFKRDVDYAIDFIVNDGVVKIYVDHSDTSSLLLNLEEYRGGLTSCDLASSSFVYGEEELLELDTLSGDYFVGGYSVGKVVNLSDGNYRLKEGEYSVDLGVITISAAYLDTLEAGGLYKFRAVTSLTDFDFYVRTDDAGVEARAAVAKYYRGDDIRFELSEATVVSKVEIDGEKIASEFVSYSEDGLTLTVAHAALDALPSGEHKAKFFTSNGRPEATFGLYSTVEIVPELPAPISHVYFFIDIGIFAALILGYLGFSKLAKLGKKK